MTKLMKTESIMLWNRKNHLLMHAMGANAGGQVGSVMAATIMADGFPVGHIIPTENLTVFMKLVQERTKNRIHFDYFPAGQMGKQTDMLEILKSGAVDVAAIGTAYVAGKLPLSGALELPGMYPNAAIGSEAFWRLTQGVLYAEEFSKHNVYPATAIAYAPYEVFNNKRPVRTVSDLKGLKLRTAGGTMDLVIKALGATPVSMVPQETYDAVSKGVLDGVAFPTEAIDSYKLQEVLKYMTKGAFINGWVCTYCFSKKAWNGLPEDIKKIVLECGLEASKAFGKAIDAKVDAYIKKYEAAGMKVAYLNEQEKKTFQDASNEVVKQWVQNQEKRNLPGKRILEESKKTVADLVGKSGK
ncbi:MAG: TRAP transporter substrate-binding protein DctP [Deltaproteobacteria bacterium]|nr:TRAP transporter substrate-binding protein DctP [Deltaproteobacteria bacterium]